MKKTSPQLRSQTATKRQQSRGITPQPSQKLATASQAKMGMQTAWRFYANVVHDWSSLNYNGHANKQDQKRLHNRYETGYELQSSSVLSDRNGLPLGVVAQNITTADGVWSRYQGDKLQVEKPHLEELAARVQATEQQGFSKPRVHIVDDREGDAVAWLRAIEESYWLVRCRRNSTVCYQGRNIKVSALA